MAGSLGVGFIGAAEIAKKNARAISLAECGLRVVAVGSRSQDKSEEFVRSVVGAEGAKAYGSYDAVFEDPAVDAVYIPLPSGIHLEWVKKAAAKGKHILLEKPICTTREDLDAIIRTCKDAGIQLMDGTMWVHNPRAALMRKTLDDPEIMGTQRSVTTSFAFSGSENFFKNDVRMSSKLDALGCLGDMGWYCIRAALFAFKYELPEYVQACPGNRFSEGGIPLAISASLIWRDGRRGFLECAFDRAPVQYLEVAGTDGAIRLEDFVIPRNEHECSFEVRDRQFLDPLATRVLQRAEERTTRSKPQEVLMWEQFAADVRAIQAGGTPNDHWPRIAYLTQSVVLAIDESARNGNKAVYMCTSAF